MYGPAVALESTATMTPPLNLKARVVVPWSKWIFTSPFSPVKRAKFWAIWGNSYGQCQDIDDWTIKRLDESTETMFASQSIGKEKQDYSKAAAPRMKAQNYLEKSRMTWHKWDIFDITFLRTSMPCGTVKVWEAASASIADGSPKPSPNPRLSFDFPRRSKPQTSASAMMNDDSAAVNGKLAIHVIPIKKYFDIITRKIPHLLTKIENYYFFQEFFS